MLGWQILCILLIDFIVLDSGEKNRAGKRHQELGSGGCNFKQEDQDGLRKKVIIEGQILCTFCHNKKLYCFAYKI